MAEKFECQIVTYLSGGLLDKFESDKKKHGYTDSELAREIVLIVLSQWETSKTRNANK